MSADPSASLNVPSQGVPIHPLYFWYCKLVDHAAFEICWDWPVPLSGENLCSESWDSTGRCRCPHMGCWTLGVAMEISFIWQLPVGRCRGACSKRWFQLPPGVQWGKCWRVRKMWVMKFKNYFKTQKTQIGGVLVLSSWSFGALIPF